MQPVHNSAKGLPQAVGRNPLRVGCRQSWRQSWLRSQVFENMSQHQKRGDTLAWQHAVVATRSCEHDRKQQIQQRLTNINKHQTLSANIHIHQHRSTHHQTTTRISPSCWRPCCSAVKLLRLLCELVLATCDKLKLSMCGSFDDLQKVEALHVWSSQMWPPCCCAMCIVDIYGFVVDASCVLLTQLLLKSWLVAVVLRLLVTAAMVKRSSHSSLARRVTRMMIAIETAIIAQLGLEDDRGLGNPTQASKKQIETFLRYMAAPQSADAADGLAGVKTKMRTRVDSCRILARSVARLPQRDRNGHLFPDLHERAEFVAALRQEAEACEAFGFAVVCEHDAEALDKRVFALKLACAVGSAYWYDLHDM